MKKKFICIIFLIFILCSCQNKGDLSSNEPSIQTINENFDIRIASYNYHCKKAGLDFFCNDVFENAEKPVKYVYRVIQYRMFFIVEDDGFAKGGINNYDVYFYEDGTAEMVYRLGLEDGKSYTFDQNVRFELSDEEINILESVLADNDFESIPTWDPEEPLILDDETTYIYGTAGFQGHLASMSGAPKDHAIYKIRSAVEQITSLHIG